MTNALLLGLSRQLAEPTLPPLPDPASEFTVPSYAVRINCFWFLSVTVSLAAGVIGILCKQWMREFQRDASLPAKDALALRQLRWMGWKKWGVPQIISLPALLLQTSLLLFLGGLLDLLWNKARSPVVATCASIIVGLTVLIMALTTVLPLVSFVRQRCNIKHWLEEKWEKTPSFMCPYKSPQSYLLLKLWDVFATFGNPLFRWRLPRFHRWIKMERNVLDLKVPKCGDYDSLVTISAIERYRSLALHWINENLAFNQQTRIALCQCISDSRHSCNRQEHYHYVLHASEEECNGDSFPDNIFNQVLSETDPDALHLEPLVRSVTRSRVARQPISASVWNALLGLEWRALIWHSECILSIAAGHPT